MALAHDGIDTGGYSFPYVARWVEGKAVLRRNLAEVQKARQSSGKRTRRSFAVQGSIQRSFS